MKEIMASESEMPIRGVSFVVISLNEEFGIEKCLASLCGMRLENCEIICVDCGSTDSTVKIIQSYMSEYEYIRAFQIKGRTNAAVARNVGIERSTRDFIFFVDGDVELREEFVRKALVVLREDKAEGVVGKLIDYEYDRDYKRIIGRKDDRYGINRMKYVTSTGGVLLVKRSIIGKVGGFDERFARNEDTDFSLRITSRFRILALPEPMGIHHTVPYGHWSRFRKEAFRAGRFLLKVMIKNFLRNRRGVLELLFHKNRGLLYGFSIDACVLLSIVSGFPLTFPLIPVIFDLAYGWLYRRQPFLYRFYTHYVGPLVTIGWVFVPLKATGEVSVIEIKPCT